MSMCIRGGCVRSPLIRFNSTSTPVADLITYSHPTAPLATYNRRLTGKLRMKSSPYYILDQILQITKEIEEKKLDFDIHTFNALLAAYTRANKYNEAMETLNKMKKIGIKPNAESYHAVLACLGTGGRVRLQMQLVEEMKNDGIEMVGTTYVQLLKGMCAAGDLKRSLDTLGSMKSHVEPNLLAYSYVIDCCVRVRKSSIAFDMMREAENANLAVNSDPSIYLKVLRSVASNGEPESVNYCWNRIMEYSIRPDEGCCLQVLRVAGITGDPKLATDVIRQLSTTGFPLKEHHFAPLMEAFLVKDDIKSAFSVLDIMRVSGVAPTTSATLPIRQKLGSNVDAIDEAYYILEQVRKEGKSVDSSAFNAVLMACAEAKDLERTIATYREASNLGVAPNVDTYNAVLEACVQTRMRGMGKVVIEEMKKANVKPNTDTYTRMIALSCTQMNYEDAFTYLEEMKSYKVVPPEKCYRILVRKLANESDPRFHIALDEMETFGYKTHALRQLWK